MYGPGLLNFGILTVDVQAPGLGGFGIGEQLNNTSIKQPITCPTNDADGSELTGLTRALLVSAVLNTDGTHPLDGLSAEQAMSAFPFVEVTTGLTPGASIDVVVGIVQLGSTQCFALYFGDH